MVRPPRPTEPTRWRVASRMALSARASRGRPGARGATSSRTSVDDGRGKALVLGDVDGGQEGRLFVPGPSRKEDVGQHGGGRDNGSAEPQAGVEGVDEGDPCCVDE